MRQTAERATFSVNGATSEGPARTGFDRVLYWRWYPGAFHALLYVTLAILVYFSFNAARQAEGNLATEVVWKLWWPGLPFILLLGGRVWCGVCPFGGISDYALKLRKRPPGAPPAVRRWGPWLGAVSVFGFGLAFLALGLEMNYRATGIILIGMTALAFGLSLVYKGRTFCRYLCPVGMITRVYSFFSWLRPHGGQVRYQGTPCPVGESPKSLKAPSQCLLCGMCTQASRPSGITATVGFGGAHIPGRREFGKPEATLSLLLLGLMAADSVRMTSLFTRFQQFALPYFDYNYRLTVIAGVSGLVGAVLAIQLIGSWLGSQRQHARTREGGRTTAGRGSGVFESIAFSYLPLTMGVFLALALQHLRYGIWPSLQTILAESRLVDWTGHMPPKSVYFTSIPLKSVQFILLGVGFYLSWRLTRRGLAGSTGNAATPVNGATGGVIARRFMVVTAATGFAVLFLFPMSGAC